MINETGKDILEQAFSNCVIFNYVFGKTICPLKHVQCLTRMQMFNLFLLGR